jgi:hypothetical protein
MHLYIHEWQVKKDSATVLQSTSTVAHTNKSQHLQKFTNIFSTKSSAQIRKQDVSDTETKVCN